VTGTEAPRGGTCEACARLFSTTRLPEPIVPEHVRDLHARADLAQRLGEAMALRIIGLFNGPPVLTDAALAWREAFPLARASAESPGKSPEGEGA
jgi:hypothetical protein